MDRNRLMEGAGSFKNKAKFFGTYRVFHVVQQDSYTQPSTPKTLLKGSANFFELGVCGGCSPGLDGKLGRFGANKDVRLVNSIDDFPSHSGVRHRGAIVKLCAAREMIAVSGDRPSPSLQIELGGHPVEQAQMLAEQGW